MTPLYRAVFWNQNELVAVLLEEYSPDIEARDDDGETPLWRAVYEGNFDNVRRLIEHRANVNVEDRVGNPVLHVAIEGSNRRIIELLLNQKPTLTTMDPRKRNVLHIAAEQSDPDILATLLLRNKAEFGAVDEEGDTELCHAAYNGNKDLAELLIQYGATVTTVNKQGRTPFHWSTAGSLSVTKLLLANGASSTAIDNNKWTALHTAAYYGNTEVAQFLIELWDTQDIPLLLAKDVYGDTALHIAADMDNADIVQLLVNRKADVIPGDPGDSEGRFRWDRMEIANPQHVDKVGALLFEKHKPVDGEELKGVLSEDQANALEWAARNGYRKLYELFWPCVQTENVRSVLYWAAVGCKESVVAYVLAKKREEGDRWVGLPGRNDIKAVQAAAQNGHVEIVRTLLRVIMQEDVSESKSKYWTTPLHWVVAYPGNESVEMVRSMLRNGENPELVDYSDEHAVSAVELARYGISQKRKDRIVDLLETPLTHPRKPLQLVNPQLEKDEVKQACRQYPANIIDFHPSDGRFYTVERKTVVQETIYDSDGGPNRIMERARKTWDIPDSELKHQFRWIHLPANNWTWVKDVMHRVSYESKKLPAEYTRIMDFVDKNRREHLGKPHARFIYPSLTFERSDTHFEEGASFLKLSGKNKRPEKKGEHDKAKLERKLSISKTKETKPEISAVEGKQTSGIVGGDGKGKTELKEPLSKPGGDQWTLEAKENGEERNSDGMGVTHLKGSKLALCIPYLTLQTVASYRKQRQAIFLAEETSKRGTEAILDGLSLACTKKSYEIIAGAATEFKELGFNDVMELSFSEYLALSEQDEADELPNRWIGNIVEHLNELLDTTSKTYKDTRILALYEHLRDAFDIYKRRNKYTMEGAWAPHVKLETLFQHYLQPSEGQGIHVTRTLDQYYYSSLADTSRRDVDQVVRRYQDAATRYNSEADGFHMGMVDQLWLWIIDGNTIITCFPHCWGHDRTSGQHLELLDNIRTHIRMNSQISSVWSLASVIATSCVDFIDSCQATLPTGPETLLQMFASSIGTAAEEEVKCFQTFEREVNTLTESAGNSLSSPKKEIELLKQVKDIRDELNIIMSICEDQKHWLEKLFGLITNGDTAGRGARDDFKGRTDLYLRMEKIKKMQVDAKIIYDSLNHLLDLKQKNANLVEAAQARRQTEETSQQTAQTVKQGRTILMFTIVTIIFLPMSFLVSIFNLNIRSFPHQGDTLSYPPSWVFARIFGSSAAITVPLIVLALKFQAIFEFFSKGHNGNKEDKKGEDHMKPPMGGIKRATPIQQSDGNKVTSVKSLWSLRWRRNRPSWSEAHPESRMEKGEERNRSSPRTGLIPHSPKF
ncbi:ankyrin [Delitschia confertaspora ATCC 74209]|uniref:Ankyrin n=1 Tax=Delitschia confertaspora ATCC 74209 TaxID=1513339 RepID=A0A9P4JF01_9PLEO|nr:ankyrin [Delitschia confertaspora ATCC 74209]